MLIKDRFAFQLSDETATEFPEDGDRHGPGHGHVEAHVAVGRPQDDGRDQEGRWIRCPPVRQLQ